MMLSLLYVIRVMLLVIMQILCAVMLEQVISAIFSCSVHGNIKLILVTLNVVYSYASIAIAVFQVACCALQPFLVCYLKEQPKRYNAVGYLTYSLSMKNCL